MLTSTKFQPPSIVDSNSNPKDTQAQLSLTDGNTEVTEMSVSIMMVAILQREKFYQELLDC